jgi:hypothetical protein
VKVESIDPDALNKQAPAMTPAPAQPAPLEAPTPTIRNPFGIDTPQNETTPAR